MPGNFIVLLPRECSSLKVHFILDAICSKIIATAQNQLNFSPFLRSNIVPRDRHLFRLWCHFDFILFPALLG